MDPFFYDYQHLADGSAGTAVLSGDMDYATAPNSTFATYDGRRSIVSTNYSASATFKKDVPAGIRRLVAGMYYARGGGYYDSTLLAFQNAAGATICSLGYKGTVTGGNNSLKVFGPSAELASYGQINDGVLRHFELIVFADATTGYWEVRQNGVTLGSGANAALASADIRFVQWAQGGNLDGQWCRSRTYYCKEWQDDQTPAPYGPIVMNWLPFTADVGSPDWIPDSGGDCTARIARLYNAAPAGAYIYSDVIGDEAEFVVTDSPVDINSLIAYMPTIICTAPQGGGPLIRADMKKADGSLVSTGPVRGALPATTGVRMFPIFTAPGGGALTKAAVDDAHTVFISVT